MLEQVDLEHFVLFVGNLPYSYVDADLEKLFMGYDKLESASIILDERERSRGFGFVRFSNVEQANAAKEKMDGSQLEGRKLRVSFARKESRYIPPVAD